MLSDFLRIQPCFNAQFLIRLQQPAIFTKRPQRNFFTFQYGIFNRTNLSFR